MRITTLNQIDDNSEQGKLLLMAIAHITSHSRTTSTPDDVIEELNITRDFVYSEDNSND